MLRINRLFALGAIIALTLLSTSCRKDSESICEVLHERNTLSDQELNGKWYAKSLLSTRNGESFKNEYKLKNGRLNLSLGNSSAVWRNRMDMLSIHGENNLLSFTSLGSTYVGVNDFEENIFFYVVSNSICYSANDQELFIHFDQINQSSQEIKSLFREQLGISDYQKIARKNILKLTRSE
jgi:hypothetical protein